MTKASKAPFLVVSKAPAVVGKFERAGLAGHVGVAGRVDRDAQAIVDIEPAEERRVDERRTGRVQLGDEGVVLIDAAPRTGVDVEAPVEGAAVVGKFEDFV